VDVAAEGAQSATAGESRVTPTATPALPTD